MNNITKKNRLIAQYKSYDDYLQYCPAESKPKLMAEMIRINQEIQRIYTMTLAQLQTQIIEYHEIKPSKLNERSIINLPRHFVNSSSNIAADL